MHWGNKVITRGNNQTKAPVNHIFHSKQKTL